VVFYFILLSLLNLETNERSFTSNSYLCIYEYYYYTKVKNNNVQENPAENDKNVLRITYTRVGFSNNMFAVLCTLIQQLTLEKTTEVVTNGQSRDTTFVRE
jgi:hypothetical protein